MSFVPSRGNLSFSDWLTEKEAWDAENGKYLSYLREALGFPTGTLAILQEFQDAWKELSRADQIELIGQARKEMAI
jgi:hypothetical protein